jgi:Ras-related protein Rab-1A
MFFKKSYTVPKKEITEFTKEIGARVENPTLKTGKYYFLYIGLFI